MKARQSQRHLRSAKHVQFQRWGISNGMQRYRCKSCLKTFNAATGTPLARLRKKEKWLEYSKAMVDPECPQGGQKMRDRQHHQFPVASPFPAWVEGQEGQQPQGDSRGRRDGVVQRFAMGRTARKRTKRGLSAEQIPVF